MLAGLSRGPNAIAALLSSNSSAAPSDEQPDMTEVAPLVSQAPDGPNVTKDVPKTVTVVAKPSRTPSPKSSSQPVPAVALCLALGGVAYGLLERALRGREQRNHNRTQQRLKIATSKQENYQREVNWVKSRETAKEAEFKSLQERLAAATPTDGPDSTEALMSDLARELADTKLARDAMSARLDAAENELQDTRSQLQTTLDKVDHLQEHHVQGTVFVDSAPSPTAAVAEDGGWDVVGDDKE